MAELVDATDLKIKESCTLLSALKAINLRNECFQNQGKKRSFNPESSYLIE